jgi:hypothetical protein
MTYDTQKLYDLLPAIERIRDSEQGEPLRALLSVIADQAAVLEEDLDRFYDDLFIETCADWVVPYIGDLIGYRSLHHNIPRISSPRAEVANTIRYRRHKGTATMLEQVARDVSGWPAKAVEFFRVLATTQFMNHIRAANTLTPDLRDGQALERLDTPFDSIAHSVDTRRIALGDGLDNIPNIGVFLWRLGAYRVLRSPAVRVDDHRFFFSPLGVNIPLFNRPEPEPTITESAEPINVPAPISRRRFHAAIADYYGETRSVFIEGVPEGAVRICDLSDHAGSWVHAPPPPGTVAIDPVLGRVAFGDTQPTDPLVTFHYGFSADMSGGEYPRAASFQLPREPFAGVAAPATIQGGIASRVPGRALQVTDNGRYNETPNLHLGPGERFELRASDGCRPTLVLGGEFLISGGDETSEVDINGLLVIGGPLRITGAIGALRLRHCTFVPGRSLSATGSPVSPGAPSLIVENGGIDVNIDHCILGGLRLHELSTARITDSIIDANAPDQIAFAGPTEPAPNALSPAGGTLRVEETTVIGKVRTMAIELISNSIVVARTRSGDGWPAPVLADRRQTGCVRFSFLPSESRVPRRYRCQPDFQIATEVEAAAKKVSPAVLTANQRQAITGAVLSWLKPAFTSLRCCDPAYGQLRRRAPRPICQGADDEGEMGGFHDLFQPQRTTNIRVRLEEYLRFGLEAGVFYVT